MKRWLGHLLLWAGFFGATLTALQNGLEIEWAWYATWLGVGVIGVVVLRMTSRTAAEHEHKVSADLDTMRQSLTALEARIRDLVGRRDATDVYDVHGTIDAELVPDLAAFAEARESMIPLWGLERYADVMTRFAGAERMINRAWSASADGYVDEVWSSLERSQRLMTESRDIFERSVESAS
ncbi:MAG: hypothetical protein OEQ13_06750 [Acidobacteriota bacterium]|nr:hypothetical protein [Acidobacteriota bacterium]